MGPSGVDAPMLHPARDPQLRFRQQLLALGVHGVPHPLVALKVRRPSGDGRQLAIQRHLGPMRRMASHESTSKTRLQNSR